MRCSKSLLVMGSKEIGLSCPVLVGFATFGMGIIVPVFHLSGKIPVSTDLLNRLVSICENSRKTIFQILDDICVNPLDLCTWILETSLITSSTLKGVH